MARLWGGGEEPAQPNRLQAMAPAGVPQALWQPGQRRRVHRCRAGGMPAQPRQPCNSLPLWSASHVGGWRSRRRQPARQGLQSHRHVVCCAFATRHEFVALNCLICVDGVMVGF